MKDYKMKINGNDYGVSIDINDEHSAEVVVNGAAYHVEVDNAKVKKSVVSKPQVAAVPSSHPVQTGAATSTAATPKNIGVASGSDRTVISPLPGVILDIKVAVGDTITAGQTLIVLEAMKMENNIDASFSGVIKSINVKCGESVLEGDGLIIIG